MVKRTDTFTTQIFLNDTQAKDRIAELERRLKSLREEQAKAAKAGDWDKMKDVKKEIKAATKEMGAMQTSAQKVSHVLDNLKTSSIKDIRQTMAAINRELRSGAIERGSKQWQFLNEQLKKCKAELHNINDESSEKEGFFAKITKFSDNTWAFFTQSIAALTGLSMSIRKCTSDYASMEEVMANTRKYTGQTDEQVRRMNEDFKRMDTRTSREQLNEFAGAAGRLGITSTKAIEEFVDAADKISVALGDDLGEGAVDQIGKLAMAFGEDDTLGLRGAMLATGSAVNELAQNSAAGASYLVDFTARLAGVGQQAGMTQTQIMAMGSVLDSNLQKDETSATALSQLITKMSQQPAKFAALAGKSVREFSNLVRTDMNGALLEFFEAMQKKGGFADLAPMFQEMGLNGSRATGVLSVLANKLGDIRDAQELANRAYNSGVSVLNEYNVQNNTVQADLDKAKKKFQELTVELGEKLLPVARYAVSTTNLGIRALSSVVNWFLQYRRTIITVAASIAALTVAVNAATIAFKIHYAAVVVGEKIAAAYRIVTSALRNSILALQLAWTLATKGVQAYTAALNASKVASAATPWTALASVILTVVAAVLSLRAAYKDHNEEAQKAAEATNLYIQKQKALSAVQQQANEDTAQERTRLKALYDILKDNNAELGERQKALNQIKRMVPEYHGALSSEGALINNNVDALRRYCDHLVEAARAQAAFNKLVDIQANTTPHQTLLNNREGNQRWVLNQMRKLGYDPTKDKISYADYKGSYIADQKTGIARDGGNLTAEQAQQLLHLQKLYDYNAKRIAQEKTIISNNDKITKELEKQVKANTSVLTGDSGNGGSGGGNGGGTTPTDANSKNKGKGRGDADAERRKRMQQEIDDAKRLNESLQAINLTRYYKGEIDYREYNAEMQRLAMDAVNKEIEIRKNYGDTSKAMDMELARAEYNQKQTEIKESEKQLEQEYKKRQVEEQLNLFNPDSDVYNNQEALNEKLYELEIEYLQRKKALQIKGSEEAYDIQQDIDTKESQHKLERQEQWEKRYQALREQYTKMSATEQEQQDLAALDALGLKEMGKTEEYEKLKMAIRLKFAQISAGQSGKAESDDIISTARSRAGMGENRSSTGDDIISVVGDVAGLKSTEEQLEQMRSEGLINEEQYLAAKKQLNSDFWNSLPQMAQAAYNTINQFMEGMSSYYSAQSEYEVAITEKKYEKLIDRAGNNSAKQKKLEEKKEKEIAAIKTKYNRKQTKIQIAQAIAQTAIAAINAYSSAAAIPVVGYILAPIAAAMATAAGMIQIATIKKQQQAQEAGYYSGGFTGGSSYRREAGVVHEGEFVANHQAVNNQQLLPAFRLIDLAQRNNTIGTLTAEAVSRSMGVGSTTVVSAPQVNVQTDNSELQATLNEARQTIDRLGSLLESGDIVVKMPDWDDFDRSRRHYDRLQANR